MKRIAIVAAFVLFYCVNAYSYTQTTSNGLTVYYENCGSNKTSALFLFHGNGGDAEHWFTKTEEADTVAHAENKDWCVISVQAGGDGSWQDSERAKINDIYLDFKNNNAFTSNAAMYMVGHSQGCSVIDYVEEDSSQVALYNKTHAVGVSHCSPVINDWPVFFVAGYNDPIAIYDTEVVPAYQASSTPKDNQVINYPYLGYLHDYAHRDNMLNFMDNY